MVSIPRLISGFHLLLIGCALLVWCGKEMGWYGRGPVIIDRRRIRSIKVGWDKEQVVGCRAGVAYSYIRPYLGIFLAFLWKEPPRETHMCLERHRDMDEARKNAREYARVLGCPLQRW